MKDANARKTEALLHLVILGGGSAAFAAAIRASELGSRATIVNDGLPIGGTCVNVGCIPSKTLIRAAEAHYRASQNLFSGIESRSEVKDFRAIIQQKKALVERLRQQKYINVISKIPGVRFIQGRGRLTASNTVEVNGEKIKGDRILIATGARPAVAPIPGLAETGYLTNETGFELERLPKSLIVLGGRYIALECAQMFARFGSRVTILQRSPRILPTEERDVTDALTQYLREEGIELHTSVRIESVHRVENQVVVKATVGKEPRIFQAQHVLAAMGRKANTEEMGLEALGVELDSAGYVRVDRGLRTRASDIYAAGDAIGEPMFVYTAAYEGALAAENAILGSGTPRDYSILPWVIFTDPQVAGVGLDERQARERGIEAEAVTLPLSEVPRSVAARDTRGFIRLIRDRTTDKLVGARILAPEGSELLMEIVLAIKYGSTTKDLTSIFHPYLTLSEGLKLAAVTFVKDVHKLSCCAT